MEKMSQWPPSKPMWVRVVGWYTLAGASLVLGVPAVEVMTAYHLPRTVWPGFVLLSLFPSLVLWLFGTIVHRARVASMVNMAAAMKRAAARAETESQVNTMRGCE